MQSFLATAWDRILVFDGGMGTALQQRGLTPDDYQGHLGCNEILVKTQPKVVREIHVEFLQAGAQVIETNTFGGARHTLAEHGLGARCYDLNRRAAELAREVSREFSTRAEPRYVAGSIGPGSKLPSLGQITVAQLQESYAPQIAGLLSGGVDCLLVETCQDLLQLKTAVAAIEAEFARAKKRVPVLVSVALDNNGQMLVGSDIATVLATTESLPVAGVGVNCGAGPQELSSAVWYLAEHSSKLLLIMPNAGKPRLKRIRVKGRGQVVWDIAPEEFAAQMKALVAGAGANIVGGCCGTTPEHIRALVRSLSAMPARKPAKYVSRVSSLYRAQELDVSPKPLICGERTNATGSRRFRELLKKGAFEQMVGVALKQEEEQAHLLDLSVACAGRNEKKDMTRLCRLLNTQCRVPVMIDSTDPEAVAQALAHLAGRCVVNSVNLEDGGKRALAVMELCRRYGAALVCLTIDERGMALTRERKMRVARRLYALARRKGMMPESLFFDFLTFTLASGDASLRNAAQATLSAIRQARTLLPGSFTVLGVSNISHGLAPEVRRALNSVFLHRAIEAGLDAAIVHAGKITPLHQFHPEVVRACDNLIMNQGRNALAKLIALTGHQPVHRHEETETRGLSREEKLREQVLGGERDGIIATVRELLRGHAPLTIIERYLLPAMDEVGRRFAQGRMLLPFVLQSAEAMRTALEFLRWNLPAKKTAGLRRGTMVLATVRGDIHDIGKNLVDMILSANGYRVVNLGIRQSPEQILSAVRRHKPDAIGLSGLLVESARAMREYLEVFSAAGISVPVICGGAALSQEYVRQELAPAYAGRVYFAPDAMAGLRILNRITAHR